MIVSRPAAALLLAATLSTASACHADIYGYVDRDGTLNLSSVQQDSRYRLYQRDAHARPGMTYTPQGALASGSTPAVTRRYVEVVREVARETAVDPALLHAVITVESGYNARARSPKGAAGLMQLMPDTARRYSVLNIWDPVENVRGGARYLRDLMAQFDDNLTLVLAAYNAGENAVIRAGHRVPPFAETLDYVPRVLSHYSRYRAAP